MNIENNIIKRILKNTYFINGTAYAGKSTLVKRLAEKYEGICCGENYHLKLADLTDKEHQPNISYMKDLKDWHEFVSRTPEEYEAWVDGGKAEIAELEIILLLQYAASGKKIFVDTNIPVDMLKEISDYEHVLIMLSPPETSVNRFFDREDAEKQFLYRLLLESEDPEKAMENFRECLKRVNSDSHNAEFDNSGFKVIRRDESRTIEQTLTLAEKHFKLL